MTPDCADAELLADFAQTRSEDAFAELVRRHVNLIYSAALRQVNGDAHLAQDVAQNVFADLARKAGSLARRDNLAGWLYTSTHFAARDLIRADNRRRGREEQFMRDPALEPAPDAAWENLRPTLDAAMHELKEADRDAILLRYFENRPFAEVGAKLGLNENAARMRVDRALEKLRAVLAKRGVATTSALAAVVSAHAVQVAPGPLAATLTLHALAGITISTTAATAITTTKAIAMSTLQKTIIGTTLAVTVGTGVFEAQQNARLKEQYDQMQQQKAVLTTQLQQAQGLKDDLNRQLGQLQSEKGSLQASVDQMELLKLRGEVSSLRAAATQANNPDLQIALAWLAKRDKLQKYFADHPEQQIPEMRYFDDRNWIDLAKNLNLDTDNDLLMAIRSVRSSAKASAASYFQEALKKYLEAHRGNPPDDPADLKPYFNSPVEDSMLARYRMITPEDLAQNSWLAGMLILERTAEDRWQERQFALGTNTWAWAPAPPTVHLGFPTELLPAMHAYQRAHDQKIPDDLAKLRPYVTTPQQSTALNNLLAALKAASPGQ